MGDKPKTEWTKERASVVQSTEAKKHGGEVPEGNYARGAQSRADKPKTEWTKERASVVQGVEAKKHGGEVPVGNYARDAQSRADKNEAANK